MTQQAALAVEASGSSAGTNQFLTFLLGAEQYGVEILKVQEIRGYSAVTPIPNTPAHIKGVINLRGTVVPVVDLRAKFSMETTEYNKFTVIIVLTVGEKVMGLVVDAVSDVLDIPAAEMRSAPDLGARVDTRFISGMATIGERMTVLLDIDRLLSEDEVVAMESLDEKESSE
jgi:purine-binding chemotaxis protein CheW